jgi:hypothetical protein
LKLRSTLRGLVFPKSPAQVQGPGVGDKLKDIKKNLKKKSNAKASKIQIKIFSS